MIFITLAKLRKKPTKEGIAQQTKFYEQMVKQGAKILGTYWTMGRYDAITIIEGKDEKSCMKALLKMGDTAATETLIAIPREEAIKLVE